MCNLCLEDLWQIRSVICAEVDQIHRPTNFLPSAENGTRVILIYIVLDFPVSGHSDPILTQFPSGDGGREGGRDGGRDGARDPASDVARVHCSAAHSIKVSP